MTVAVEDDGGGRTPDSLRARTLAHIKKRVSQEFSKNCKSQPPPPSSLGPPPSPLCCADPLLLLHHAIRPVALLASRIPWLADHDGDGGGESTCTA